MARKHKKDLLQKGSPSCPYSVGVLIANDITGNALLRIRHQGLGGVDGAVPMMVLGAVLLPAPGSLQRPPGCRNRRRVPLCSYIYLIHFPMLILLERTGIRPLASRLLTGSVIGELLYPLILTVALLLFSIPAAEIFMAAHRALTLRISS